MTIEGQKNLVATGEFRWGPGTIGFGFVIASLFVSAGWKFLALNQAVNNLKCVGLALHQYHDKHGSFPPAVERASDGSAARSWRSLIGEELGSPPSWENAGWFPHYMFFAAVGPGAAWTDDHPRKISEFKDGTSDTILLIGIRHSGVRWQEPVDLEVRGDALFLGDREIELTSDVFLLMADGSTRYQQKGLRPDQLHPLLTVAAGDAVQEW